MKDRYDRYKKKMELYKHKRKALLKEPEEQLHEVAEDLDIYNLRRSVQVDLKKLRDVANDIYKNIWNGNPQNSDIIEFLSTVDKIMQYEEFVSAEEMKKWQVAHNLVSAFGKTFKQQEKIGDE